MEAGRLRHRIDIYQKVTVQDSTGDPVPSWVLWAEKVAAEVAPLSAREFLGQNQILAQATAKILIRYRAGIDPTMRISHNGTIYNILGVLPDPDSGLDYMLLPASRGTNEG